MVAIPPERCVGGTDLTEPRMRADGQVLVYASSTQGEAALVVHRFDGSADTQVATSPAIRPGRGMGGGAWCYTADGAGVIYVAADGNLWQQALTGEAPVLLTDHGPERAAASPVAAPDGSSVVYVVDSEEVHRLTFEPPVDVRLDGNLADFCSDPFIESDSVAVGWVAWDIPDMPWDHSRVLRIGADGVVREALRPPGAVQQPQVLPDGTLTWVRDDTGWLNVWAGERPVVDEPVEHAGPSWGPGQRSFAWAPEASAVAFTRNEGGFGRLCIADAATATVREVARGVHGQLSWAGGRLAAVRSGARTPTQVVVYDTTTFERTTIAVGPSTEWQPGELLEPELVEVPAADGIVHARLYRAPQADGRLIVWLHGGPTDQWQVTFMPRCAFWLSRGWSILAPDHRGSTGHGRGYQQALRGRWGELDVADTLAAARYAHAVGWSSPAHTVVFGGSAGGFTALNAVAAEPRRFAAAVVLYPVTDLVDLSERSHRFERHYTVSLVGPLPESVGLYRERSPVLHADRCIDTPLLLLHGDVDAVVPVQQSEVFAERVRVAGGEAELHVYEGEGHGFRQLANQLDEYQRTEDFLARRVPVTSRT